MIAAEKLTEKIPTNYDNPLRSTIDVPAQVESLFQSLGATSSDSGGKSHLFRGRSHHSGSTALQVDQRNLARGQGDPDRTWKERTGGRGLDIHVDVRKALRRRNGKEDHADRS